MLSVDFIFGLTSFFCFLLVSSSFVFFFFFFSFSPWGLGMLSLFSFFFFLSILELTCYPCEVGGISYEFPTVLGQEPRLLDSF